MEATRVSWKSGSVVRLSSGGDPMSIIGSDSVGSMICRPLHDERHPGIYVPPSLLVAADPKGDGTLANTTHIAAENA